MMLSVDCASRVVWHEIKNISAYNEAMLLKLGSNVAPHEIYQMVYILMLLRQHARFRSDGHLRLNEEKKKKKAET